MMLETVIVGGGLCGLTLAREWSLHGRRVALFEARDRLGGRILSKPCVEGGVVADLGPGWYWPATQPRIHRLAQQLGLASFPQHDAGEVLGLTDPNGKAQRLDLDQVHGGAMRLEGGMSTLVHALAGCLAPEIVQLHHVLTAVFDRGDHVELHFLCHDRTLVVAARHAVLAVPPRLLEEHVEFHPPLDEPLRQAMRATPTWMAGQAKAVVAYDQAFWREKGQSGNAFVNHAQAVLSEIYDACDAAGDKTALAGFFALPPALRASIRFSMPMLITSQLVQVFGPEAEQGRVQVHDWAGEALTCSTLDLAPAGSHPEYGDPNLRRALWEGRLHFGGAETASVAGGYMEGALETATRILRDCGAETVTRDGPVASAAANNAACVSRFEEWVVFQRRDALERYRRHLHQDLASQRKEQLTQRALLGTVEQIYSEALGQIDSLPFDTAAVGVQNGRSDLVPGLLAPFLGFSKALLDEALKFNGGSCAISNFPDEHKPAGDYVVAIAGDLAAAWREFALSANKLLLARAGAAAVTASKGTRPVTTF